jgi:transposase-like protein
MFQPPRCPHRRCAAHADPPPRFCKRHGSYAVLCRAHRVPRFRCKSCGRTFSRQTFRMDYHDHRPDLNARLFELLASGVGLRQCARNLGLSLRCTELKARKLGRHLRRLNLNLRGALSEGAGFQLDELETYEDRRNTRPLSVPVLIEKASRFIVWAESAPIRPSGRMSAARRAAIAAEERRYGPRRDFSRSSVRRTLRRGSELARELDEVPVDTDEKLSYPLLLHAAFGSRRLRHTRTNSKLARGTWNPLFAINHTEAMARDLMGRLRRESWLVSKRRRWLDIALHVFIAYRNYVRRRFNSDKESPAQTLGFAPRRMTLQELLSWRQDGGIRSIHPLAREAESVADFAMRSRAAA